MKRKKRGCGCLGICVLLFLLFTAFLSREQIKEWFFPRDYEEAVTEICAPYGIDPWLVMAIIREESGFDPEAGSTAGACGLMQLMPTTAEWVIRQAGFSIATEQALTDPYWNIAVGVWYLDWLMEWYGGGDALPMAVAAYNAGYTTVDEWQKSDQWDGSLENAEEIPYAETRQYVKYVYRSYALYQKLYT